MLKDVYYICEFSGGERRRGGIMIDEIVEKRNGNSPTSLGKEDAGKKEAKGVGGEAFLD